MCGRQTLRKAIVAIAVEKDGQGVGRVRLRLVGDVSADSLMSFVRSAVEPGSVVQTDGWASYNGLKDAGYRHEVTVITWPVHRAALSLPGVRVEVAGPPLFFDTMASMPCASNAKERSRCELTRSKSCRRSMWTRRRFAESS